MKNLFNSLKKTTNELFAKNEAEALPEKQNATPAKQDNAGFHREFIQKGQHLYLPEHFVFNDLLDDLNRWFSRDKNFATKQFSQGAITILQYKPQKGFKSSLGLSVAYHLYLAVAENELLWAVRRADWVEDFENFSEENKLKLGSFIQESYEDDIEQWLSDYVLEKLLQQENVTPVDTQNRYTVEMSKAEQTWFYAQQEKDELLLAYMDISAARKLENEELTTEKTNWKFALTSHSAIFIAFDETNGVLHQIDVSGQPFVVKKEIGRNPVKVHASEWLTSRNNSGLFYEIQTAVNLHDLPRMREIARLNWIHNAKDTESNAFAFTLLEKIIRIENNPFDELSLLFVELAEKKRENIISSETTDEKLVNALKRIVGHAETENQMTKWAEKWELSHIDAFALMQILMRINLDDSDLMRILPFHRKVRRDFEILNKDKIAAVIFDLQFCSHLIHCDKNKEAIKLLEKHLPELPNETLSDLLPASNINPAGEASGQILRINLLDLLVKAKGKENAIGEIQQLAQLQPLVKKRIAHLLEVASGDLATRTHHLSSMLEAEALKFDENTEASEPKPLEPLSSQLLDTKMKHPASRQGGVFGALQSWLAEVEIPDYSAIKSFSERLSEKNFPLLNTIVADIKHAMRLEGVETYIARGDKATGIDSFEGNPSFLIIGVNHLTEESEYYMTTDELKFAIATELAHLHYKHSRITSTDVWKGAKDKGLFLIDAVLSVIPMVGLLGNSVRNIARLNAIAAVLQRVQQIENFTEKSKEIVEVTSQAVGVYKNTTKYQAETDREKELLATSRIMQLTADRAGLLFSNSLKAAVRAMFLSSPLYQRELDVATRYGLNSLLLKQDDEGNYLHQELAVRLAAMFSFYLSNDYQELKEAIKA